MVLKCCHGFIGRLLWNCNPARDAGNPENFWMGFRLCRLYSLLRGVNKVCHLRGHGMVHRIADIKRTAHGHPLDDTCGYQVFRGVSLDTAPGQDPQPQISDDHFNDCGTAGRFSDHANGNLGSPHIVFKNIAGAAALLPQDELLVPQFLY